MCLNVFVLVFWSVLCMCLNVFVFVFWSVLCMCFNVFVRQAECCVARWCDLRNKWAFSTVFNGCFVPVYYWNSVGAIFVYFESRSMFYSCVCVCVCVKGILRDLIAMVEMLMFFCCVCLSRIL
jgi:hypothetical protein